MMETRINPTCTINNYHIIINTPTMDDQGIKYKKGSPPFLIRTHLSQYSTMFAIPSTCELQNEQMWKSYIVSNGGIKSFNPHNHFG